MSKSVILFDGQFVAVDDIGVSINSPLDSFGRLITVQPNSIFDYKGGQYLPQYRLNTRTLGSGASITNNQNENSIDLTTTGSTNGEAIAQSFKVMLYESAIGMEINFTIVFDDTSGYIHEFCYGGGWGDDNVGQGDAVGLGSIRTDGISLRSEDNLIYFDLWSSTSGVPIRTQEIPRSAWDDPMNGNGASGINIDFTKSVIGKISFQYLGYGFVKLQFDINGQIYTAHTINNVNTDTKPFMRRGSQPIRVRNYSKGTGVGTSTFRLTCVGVVRYDNDGDRFEGQPLTFSRSTTYRNPSDTDWYLLYVSRLADGVNFFTVEIEEGSVGSDSNAIFDFVFGQNIPLSPSLPSTGWTPLFTQNAPIEFFYPETGTNYGATVTDQSDNIAYRARGFPATDSIAPNLGGRSVQFTRDLDGTAYPVMAAFSIPSGNRERMSFSFNCVGGFGG